MKNKLFITLFLIIGLMLSMQGALAASYCKMGPPQYFYGDLDIDGSDAPSGTQMRAILSGGGGTYTTTVAGQYGNAATSDKFIVYGASAGYDDGVPTITFDVFANGQWRNSVASSPFVCGGETELNIDVTTGGSGCTDGDDDGYCDDVDCDDSDDSVYPGADEDCDGIDNDCDAGTPDGADEPSLGTLTSCGVGECAAAGTVVCSAGALADTCTAGAPVDEVCDDGLDNDCDGATDEGCAGCTDGDGDGYCLEVDDCDDTDASINPAASDVNCDNVDDNCDGTADEGYVSTPTSCGVGECAAAGTMSCVAGAEVDSCTAGTPVDEVCDDGLDNNCDGTVDEGCTQGGEDTDGDGVPDDQDVCPGFDDNVDSDGDTVPDGCDVCAGFDDAVDTDADGTPDGCDICVGFDDAVDSDGDTVPDGCDLCEGYPDDVDSDSDGTPDGCDSDVEKEPTSVDIYNGWTYFSLPLDPLLNGVSNSQELGDAIMADTGLTCDVLMYFDGATQQMVDDVLTISDPTFALAGPPQAYIIYCDGDATYNYEGTAWG
ncbi:MAG: hypothetical protein GY861_27385 [bacterium]|nr:hypothetical protein [bacterium]